MSARRAGNNRHSHPSRGSNARMHNALRQISARPFQRLTVGASGSDRPVATGETPCRVAARAGGMPRYFPLTVAASSSRPMNLGGTPRHRSWTRVYVPTGGRGTNSRGHPPGRAASTLGVICRCGCRVRCVKGGVSVPAGQDVLYVSLSRGWSWRRVHMCGTKCGGWC
jgi:hypothetical protein